MTTLLRLEMLPELRSGTGLYLRRVRAVLEVGNGSVAALGAGISTLSDTAKEKAVSEALERLTLDPAAQFMVSTTSLVVSGTLLRPVSAITDLAPIKTTDAAWTASACHVDLESAIRATAMESAERRHLWEWSAQCEHDGPLTVGQPPPESFLVPEITNFLANFPIEIAMSWATPQASLPALVVIALRPSQECFYAASAAGEEWSQAFEDALLDIAKVLIIEQQLASSTGAFSFRRPLVELPDRIRHYSVAQSLVRWPPAGKAYVPLKVATLFGAPWLTLLNRQMIEIPLVLQGTKPKPLDWFK